MKIDRQVRLARWAEWLRSRLRAGLRAHSCSTNTPQRPRTIGLLVQMHRH